MKTCAKCHCIYPDEYRICPKCHGAIPRFEGELPFRTDGLYCNDMGSYTSYLRLYEDGTVLYRESIGMVETASWILFKKEPSNGRGNLRIEDGTVFFDVQSSQGKYLYSGFFHDKDTLVVKYKTLDERKSGKRIYTFSPIKFVRP